MRGFPIEVPPGAEQVYIVPGTIADTAVWPTLARSVLLTPTGRRRRRTAVIGWRERRRGGRICAWTGGRDAPPPASLLDVDGIDPDSLIRLDRAASYDGELEAVRRFLAHLGNDDYRLRVVGPGGHDLTYLLG